MQVKQLKEDGLAHELEVTVPAKDIDTRADARLQEVGKTVKMPGFRPGKVPLNLLKQKYGRSIMGEVLELVVNETSQKALEDKKLTPALQPQIEVKSFDEGKDLIYTMKIEVLPKIEIADYRKFKLTKPVAKAGDKEIDEALTRLASMRKDSAPIEGKRASKKGDIVVIDFHGRTADDNKEHPGMHAHGHNLELGSGQFIPGFEDQLTGKKAGESVEVKVTFPENYGATELAGREAIFDVDINEIREPKEASIDDEFAKSFGLEDLATLRKALADQSEHEFTSLSRMKVKKELLDLLDETHDFAIPQGLKDMEYENILRQVEMDHQQRGGDGEVSEEEKTELKDIADRRVRLGLVLSEIGKTNNIQVSNQELQRAVIDEAQKYPGQEKQVFDYFSKNRQALESLRAPIYEDKVVDFILELAEVTEKEISVEELTAEDEEAETTPKKKKAAAKKSSSKKSDEKAKKEDE
ncbi:MAG: trigger factor [Alphaproteobacteria bacterium]|nr:trigger factor [Alphaproteobacteria bacterium]